MNISRNGKILIVLLMVLCVAVIHRILNPFQQQTVDSLTYTGKPGEAAASSHRIHKNPAERTEALVLLDLMINPPQHSDKTVRDLFSMPKAVVETSNSTGVSDNQTKTAEQAAAKESDPATLIREEIQQFRIFGLYEKAGKKILFLEKDKDVLMVREGDRIHGKYLVERITDRDVVFKSEDMNVSVAMDMDGLSIPKATDASQ